MTLVALAVALAFATPPAGPVPARGAPSSTAPSALVRLAHGVRPYVRLEGLPVGGLMPAEVDSLLAEIARGRDRAPVEARLDRATGSVLPERDGTRLDARATRAALVRAAPFANVAVTMRPVPARWRHSDIARLTAPLGTYTTWIGGSAERRANIALASRLLRYRLVYPGQVFSFVAAVGPGSRAQGYKLAPTIQDGQMVPGLGGGVCQLSSTLYNAALGAGLRVVERHHHALRVHYVPAGRDATVVLPGEHPPAWLPRLDLRLRNDLSHPVYLDARVTGWRLTVRVLGDPADARRASLGSQSPRHALGQPS